MSVRHLDFFCDDGVIADRGRALAYRNAWELAVRHRAPKALRADLRFFMRLAAREAVAGVRRVVERRLVAAGASGLDVPQQIGPDIPALLALANDSRAKRVEGALGQCPVAMREQRADEAHAVFVKGLVPARVGIAADGALYVIQEGENDGDGHAQDLKRGVEDVEAAQLSHEAGQPAGAVEASASPRV